MPSLYCIALLSEFWRIIRSSSAVKRRWDGLVVSLLDERHLQNISDKIQTKTRAANKTADTTIAVVLSTAILKLLEVSYRSASQGHWNTRERFLIIYEFCMSLRPSH